MGEKVVNLLLDIVKYVFTAMLIYPFLADMEKDWRYYSLVGGGIVALSAVATLLKRFLKKKNDNQTPPPPTTTININVNINTN
jgi:hypothetical protein